MFAIQNISGAFNDPKFYIYNYDQASNVWNLTNKTLQAKAVRFDILGNVYYLSTDNCALNAQFVKIACGLKDFEVLPDGRIVGISDGSSGTVDTVDGPFRPSGYGRDFKTLNPTFKGLTLLKGKVVTIDNQFALSTEFNSEQVVAISAGIDESLWALKYEPLVGNETASTKNYKLIKW